MAQTLLSKFNLAVSYMPAPENYVADALSRWMYPARSAFQDVSKHGSKEAAAEMKEIIRQEEAEERAWVSSVQVTEVGGLRTWTRCGSVVARRRVEGEAAWWTAVTGRSGDTRPSPSTYMQAPDPTPELSPPCGSHARHLGF